MFAVVMAGGSGTRFWPASSETLPKQFLCITGERSMLEETLSRVTLLVGAENTCVVINRDHLQITRRILGDATPLILTEPRGRNTAACIGLAAVHLAQVAPSEPMVVLPADHFVGSKERFGASIERAAGLARSGGIVTLGVSPSRPETGYGYLEVDQESNGIFRVSRFVEKPDRPTALAYATSGRHLWNAGIFAFTPDTILSEIRACLPALYDGLLQVRNAIGRPEYETTLETVYSRLESISIDHGVMEKTEAPIYALSADFGWSDVGSWEAVYELRDKERDENGNLFVGDAVGQDARRNLVYSSGDRLVALLGVENLAVIDTAEALLVADLRRSQEVKQLQELLKQRQGSPTTPT
jgi:mannose-1-phosphate guanylyltransferase